MQSNSDASKFATVLVPQHLFFVIVDAQLRCFFLLYQYSATLKVWFAKDQKMGRTKRFYFVKTNFFDSCLNFFEVRYSLMRHIRFIIALQVFREFK